LKYKRAIKEKKQKKMKQKNKRKSSNNYYHVRTELINFVGNFLASKGKRRS